jgi:hypothetical protein
MLWMIQFSSMSGQNSMMTKSLGVLDGLINVHNASIR